MEQIEGRHPVLEALRAGRPMRRILVAETANPKGTLSEIISLARERGVRVERVPRVAIDRRSRSRTHQGVLAEAERIRMRSWRESVAAAREAGRSPLLLALDGIEDPQNLGALLRSAEAFGVDAVLIPRRRSAGLGPAAAKASAGAIEHLAIDEVPNLERALATCKEEGIWVVALAPEGSEEISTCALLSEPVVIVVGAEGRGVSRLVEERADARVRIGTTGRLGSLNASVAGAICLWEARRNRSR